MSIFSELLGCQEISAEQTSQVQDKRISATILTGFLGAGKTTFLNYILKSWDHGKQIAVVQNEFGSVPIDDQLMLVEKSANATTVTLPNGCVCCSVRGDLGKAMQKLAIQSSSSGKTLDHLLIECSGLSEVLPVAQTFFGDPFVEAVYRLDGVVCIADAANFEAMEGGIAGAEGSSGEDVAKLLREQLSIADVCLLNKIDLVNEEQVDRIGKRILQLNPSAKLVPCRNSVVDLDQVLSMKSFTLDEALTGVDPHFNKETEVSGHGPEHETSHGGSDHQHTHSNFGSLGLEMPECVDLEALENFLANLGQKHKDRLVRIKGVVRYNPSAPKVAIVQGVGAHIEINDQPGKLDISKVETSRLVFIGRFGDFEMTKMLRDGWASVKAA
mmetsp:Transcript_99335/g.206924  ORF Transcript_99335/g.206924 Transcript_99335/m.206924 type:complete len:385 (+) Transcript_99335:167-1321(+)|eukprot:CAMPEP_0206476322 /NCGR_PEP_ID=MMETSP0324_2-20121206/34650_1 /ASSEMBLY_ACC=CAM_ASM_000836 /TAXON_ID=2866 /ORGANISM="Crypthecodinium cohnii, Strain Seligo" /LENGTH=384 /DNA_ID=CAMNT_0053951937 /DNA_START=103 /DNA_END=1257 /DNA_ORIENTATION=-